MPYYWKYFGPNGNIREARIVLEEMLAGNEFASSEVAVVELSMMLSNKPELGENYYYLVSADARLGGTKIVSQILPPHTEVPEPSLLLDMSRTMRSRSDLYWDDGNIEYYTSWSPPESPRYVLCRGQMVASNGTGYVIQSPRLVLSQILNLHSMGQGFAIRELLLASVKFRHLIDGIHEYYQIFATVPGSADPDPEQPASEVFKGTTCLSPETWGTLLFANFPRFNSNQENAIMPPESAATAVTAPALTHTPNSLVRAHVRRDTTSSRLALVVDAKPLHDLLTQMGVPIEDTTFANRPGARHAVASADFQLSTEVLLRRAYPHTVNLSAIWGEPPTIPQLRKLGESIHTAVRKILEHYRPIDISFSVVKVADKVK